MYCWILCASDPLYCSFFSFFFHAEDGIRDTSVTGVQTCALPIFIIKRECCREHSCQAIGRINARCSELRSEERRVGKECRWKAIRQTRKKRTKWEIMKNGRNTIVDRKTGAKARSTRPIDDC